MLDHRSTMLRAIKGAPVSIVLALMLYPERSLGPAQLAALTGYSRNTIASALQVLAELGLAQRHARYSGWRLTLATQQLFLPYPTGRTDTQLAAAQLTDTPLTATQLADCDAQNLSFPLEPDAQNLGFPEADARILGIDAQNLCVPSSLVSSSKRSSGANITKNASTTNLLPADAQDLDLARLLLDVGVYAPVVIRLTHDPWCTIERAEAWIANIRHQMLTPNHGIRSLPALLATNLQDHLEPPPALTPSKGVWQRVRDRQYADYF